MQDTEGPHGLRQMITRGVVRSTNDTAETQTATVTTARHVDRTDVEVVQPFGVASRPPAGGLGIVLAVGNDQGDAVLLPLAAPRNRMGKLKEGEAALYGHKGDKVHVKADGTIEAASSKEVISKVKEAFAHVKEDRVVGRLKEGRFVVREGYVKMRFKSNWIVIKDDGIYCSRPIVIGPDPEPDV